MSAPEIKDAYQHGFECKADEEYNERLRECLRRLPSYAVGRKILYTNEGYIGLGCWEARPGDCIYAVLGCHNLLVLRPATPGHFGVAGICNLHGFMDFEAILGPLPDGWYVEDEELHRDTRDMRFVDTITGKKLVEDPKLPAELPAGWTREIDGDGHVTFLNDEKNMFLGEDPRVSDVPFLRSRGVDVQDIFLI
jgi:hypothetical protein